MDIDLHSQCAKQISSSSSPKKMEARLKIVLLILKVSNLLNNKLSSTLYFAGAPEEWMKKPTNAN